MNSKTFVLPILSVFIALLAVSIVSADIEFAPTSTTAVGAHNTDIVVSFSLNNTGAVNYTGIVFSGSVGSWSNLPASTTLNAGEMKSFTATLHIPQYASGTYNAVLHATTTPAANADFDVAVTIPVAPALSMTNTQSLTKTQGGIVTITNTGNTLLNNINLTTSGEFNVSLSTSHLSLAAGGTTQIFVTATSNLSDMGLGDHAVTITAKDLTTTAATASVSYTITEDFCDNGNVNTSRLDITNVEDQSSNEWEWKPLDNVEIEVEVENNIGDDDETDFVVEFALYDTVDDDYVELDGEDILEQDISIDDDDSQTVTFEFQVPIDVEDSDGRYVVFVKAYVDGDEDQYCNSGSAVHLDTSADAIKINKDDNEVTLGEISAPEMVKAGDVVTISARAFNIGNSDQDKVYVLLSNARLALDMESPSFGLDSGDSDLVEFSFVVPYTAENGAYALKLTTFYKYKKSSDSYSDHLSASDIKMTVAGGTNATVKPVASEISATLDSEARAGDTMEITTTIKNLGSNQSTFVVDVKGYDSWATLNSISDRMLTLNAGESKDVTISFDVNKDASGEQTFTIESKSGTKIDSKTVAVEIAKGSMLSSLTESFKNKTVLWIIGAINLVLIILIFYLAVRIFRK